MTVSVFARFIDATYASELAQKFAVDEFDASTVHFRIKYMQMKENYDVAFAMSNPRPLMNVLRANIVRVIDALPDMSIAVLPEMTVSDLMGRIFSALRKSPQASLPREVMRLLVMFCSADLHIDPDAIRGISLEECPAGDWSITAYVD